MRGGATPPDLAECELTLWHDHPDPDKRENEGVPRFWLTVGVVDDGRPIIEFWGENEIELRAMLNAWHEEHVGYRPDDDEAVFGAPTPLGILMHGVGVAVFLHFNEEQ